MGLLIRNIHGFYWKPKLLTLSITILLVLFMSTFEIKSSYAVETYSFLTKWGSFGSVEGKFKNPSGIAVDSSGNVYVADTSNSRIQKFDSSGEFLGKRGSFGSTNGKFNNPSGIAVDSSGNVYVSDSDNNRIQKFDSSGTFLTKWGSLGFAKGKFNNPSGIAVDSSGNVYVADTFNNRIQVFGIPVGGTEIPIDTTALLLYGIQNSIVWWTPVIVIVGAGIGLLKLKKRN